MATQADLRQRVRNNVYGAYPTDQPFVTILGAAIADGTTTTVTVADGTDWSQGDVVEIDETAEQLMVTSISTNDLTVLRGWNNTTAAAATDGGKIFKNPRFTIQQIDEGLDACLASFESWGVHVFGTGSVTRDSLKYFYELSETDINDAYGVLAVYYVELNTLIPVPLPFKFHQGLGTGDANYSTGAGLQLAEWGDVSVGSAAQYVYAKNLTSVTDLGTNQEEVLVLGATALVLGKNIIPASHDPGARTDRTIPVGQVGRDGRWFQGEFFIRVRAEAANVATQRQKRFPSTVRIARARRWRP